MYYRILIGLVLSALIFLSCSSEKQRPVLDVSLGNPADSGSRFPSLYTHNGETVFMSWLSNIEEEVYALEYASFQDGSWSDSRAVHVGSNYFANWADFPSITGIGDDLVALHWLRKIEGGPYAYNVQISFPAGSERQWNHITPHLDGTATEHGFVSMHPMDRDRVLAIWLDGRLTEGRSHHDYSDPDRAMTLRSAVIGRDGTIEHKRVIDSMVCDCCQTDIVEIDGALLAVYRDRTKDEVRDISIARYDLESHEWSDPVAVHDDGWVIGGCPVNGPRIAANDEQVAVVWYTEAGQEKRVLAAFSDDFGATFSEPVQLASGPVLGRVDVQASPDGAFYASWMEMGDRFAELFLQEIEPGEDRVDRILIGTTDLSRSSGFPRLAATNEGILIAWTQTEPVMRARTAFYRYEDVRRLTD